MICKVVPVDVEYMSRLLININLCNVYLDMSYGSHADLKVIVTVLTAPVVAHTSRFSQYTFLDCSRLLSEYLVCRDHCTFSRSFSVHS